MVSLIVKNIIEEDFGCEGRPEGHKPKCKVILRDFSGNEMDVFIDDEEYEKSDKQDIIKAQVGWESSTNQPLEDRAYWVKSYTDYIESTGVYIGYNTDRKPL